MGGFNTCFNMIKLPWAHPDHPVPGPLAIDQLGVHQRLEKCGRGLLFAAHGEGLTLLQRCSDLMCDGKHGTYGNLTISRKT